MRNFLLIVSVLLVALLVGCTSRFPAIETEYTTPPPVETELTSVSIHDFTDYYQLIEHSSDEKNWIFFSMGCLFSQPEDVALNYLFYLGVGYNGSWQDISEESRAYLVERDFMEEMDLQIMPAETIEKILQSTFGISRSDVQIPSEWAYLENEDVFCSNHNDAYVPGPFTITDVIEYSDGTVKIYYTVEYFYDGNSGEFFDDPTLILKLLRQDDGSWLVMSNTFA